MRPPTCSSGLALTAPVPGCHPYTWLRDARTHPASSVHLHPGMDSRAASTPGCSNTGQVRPDLALCVPDVDTGRRAQGVRRQPHFNPKAPAPVPAVTANLHCRQPCSGASRLHVLATAVASRPVDAGRWDPREGTPQWFPWVRTRVTLGMSTVDVFSCGRWPFSWKTPLAPRPTL